MAGQNAPAAEPVITKRRVTMRNVVARGIDAKGNTVLETHEAVDYVRPDFLDAYLEDARKNWQTVVVSDEPDAGPAGYHGATVIPEHLDHPAAGAVFPATKPGSEG